MSTATYIATGYGEPILQQPVSSMFDFYTRLESQLNAPSTFLSAYENFTDKLRAGAENFKRRAGRIGRLACKAAAKVAVIAAIPVVLTVAPAVLVAEAVGGVAAYSAANYKIINGLLPVRDSVTPHEAVQVFHDDQYIQIRNVKGTHLSAQVGSCVVDMVRAENTTNFTAVAIDNRPVHIPDPTSYDIIPIGNCDVSDQYYLSHMRGEE